MTITPDQLIKSLRIPPRPEVLIEFTQQAQQANCSPQKLADILKTDVSLMAALLQLVNSPLFALPQHITSAQQALNLLGVPRSLALVRTVALRNSVGDNLALPRFWDTATETAQLCEKIAKLLTGLNIEDAYTLGLFHNCGIPLMIQAFDDYMEILKAANQTSQPLEWLENSRYKITNCRLGYELAKHWFLPRYIRSAILYNPVYEDVLGGKVKVEEPVGSLLAILQAAKHTSESFRQIWRIDDAPPEQKISPYVLEALSISDFEFADLQDQLLGELEASCSEPS